MAAISIPSPSQEITESSTKGKTLIEVFEECGLMGQFADIDLQEENS